MGIQTKRGNLDNIVTYTHICDTIADMDNIPAEQKTLGSTCIIVDGDNGLEVYISDSQGIWHSPDGVTIGG